MSHVRLGSDKKDWWPSLAYWAPPTYNLLATYLTCRLYTLTHLIIKVLTSYQNLFLFNSWLYHIKINFIFILKLVFNPHKVSQNCITSHSLSSSKLEGKWILMCCFIGTELGHKKTWSLQNVSSRKLISVVNWCTKIYSVQNGDDAFCTFQKRSER